MGRTSIGALGLTALAALALAAAGCGGGGSKSAAPTTTAAATATEAAATGAGTTTAAATTEAVTTTATEVVTTEAATTTTTADLSGLASAANCRELADLGSKFSTAITGTGSQDVKKEAALLQEFASKTPADIRPDFKVIADAFSKIADAVGNLKAGATPDAEAIAKLAKLGTELDQAKLTQAEEHIAAWVTKNCHA